MNNKDGCILIVDDEKANILLLTKILNINGYNNIIETTDSEEVMNIVSENKISLILMDINMPFMNGYEVLKHLGSNPEFKDIPAIAISGDVSSSDINAATEAGFIHYLTKPIKIADLINVVNKVML